MHSIPFHPSHAIEPPLSFEYRLNAQLNFSSHEHILYIPYCPVKVLAAMSTHGFPPSRPQTVPKSEEIAGPERFGVAAQVSECDMHVHRAWFGVGGSPVGETSQVAAAGGQAGRMVLVGVYLAELVETGVAAASLEERELKALFVWTEEESLTSTRPGICQREQKGRKKGEVP